MPRGRLTPIELLKLLAFPLDNGEQIRCYVLHDDDCICCFLTGFLVAIWLVADSAKAVLILSPYCQR